MQKEEFEVQAIKDSVEASKRITLCWLRENYTLLRTRLRKKRTRFSHLATLDSVAESCVGEFCVSNIILKFHLRIYATYLPHWRQLIKANMLSQWCHPYNQSTKTWLNIRVKLLLWMYNSVSMIKFSISKGTLPVK